MRALAALSAAGLLLTACGGTAQRDRTWRQNVAGLVAQLQADVQAVQSTPASTDLGDQYALLVAYSDMGGCSAMVAATGAPPAVLRALARPCPRLEQAATLFTRAETHAGAGELRRAARVAAGAQPELVRAALAYGRGEK